MRKAVGFAIATVLTCAALIITNTASTAADLSAARDNFTAQCSKCHGDSGRGDGPAGASLPVKPRNFTDCSRMSKESDGRLFNVIKAGGAVVGLSKEMPPWHEAFDDGEISGADGPSAARDAARHPAD
jgi:hypothetical protein